MSKDLNMWQGIGRLGQAPETNYTANGTAVTNISLACGDDYKDKNGQMVEQTNWVRVVAWNRLAEIMAEYLTKGSQVYIQGKQVTRKWQDKEGQDRYTTEIVANQLQMLDTKSSSAGDGAGANHQKPQSSPPASGSFDDSDDIPF